MTVRRAIVAAIALLIVAFLVWRWSALPALSPSNGSATRFSKMESVTSGTSATSPQAAAANRPSAIPEPRSTLADSLNSPATDIRADLRLVSEIVATFRTNFPRDGNPTGTNAEITAVLTGKNKLRLALIPPDHRAINQAGELCDRWGTPFFFHAESATRMEIRSAGPDKKMWSDDDVALSP